MVSSGQSSWLQIQRSGFDSQRYQISWEVVGLERGPLSLVSTTEELLGRESSDSGPENLKYGCRDRSRWPRGNLYPHKLALISPTSGGLSVVIVRSRTQATEFSLEIKHEDRKKKKRHDLPIKRSFFFVTLAESAHKEVRRSLLDLKQVLTSPKYYPWNLLVNVHYSYKHR
jgi:hypothetical protein